ncbi:MAG: chromosome segregation protein SMC [Fimbriimonadia bacterium]|nr:chromosome segregation protein SMC [Fimbriimonadia bacterium]
MPSVLKRIRLHGFKTFAQRAEINLQGDLIAVVGPNGCGKSNLVDAIVWALGENSARALRAGTATEVIFSGSSGQKPLGMAEVSLWFDNETRWLPLDVDEVQITRRLYRSGEWECWINKTPARLRDLADLLAGTGLGRGGYAIIGQGDVEGFLNATPEERRQWIEEAAGVSLYRNRRKETLRDLDSTRMHLQRAQDVLNELDLQREPLKEEAERAKHYRALREQLRAIEQQWLRQEFRQNEGRGQTMQQERETLRQSILSEETEIAQMERQAESMGATIAQLETEMDTLRGVQSGFLSALERMEGRLSALQERREAMHHLHEATQEEIKDLQARSHQTEQSLQQLETRLSEARQRLAPAEEQSQALQAEANEQGAQVERLQSEWQAAMKAQAEWRERERRLESLLPQTETAAQTLSRCEQEAQTAEADLKQTLEREEAFKSEMTELETELRDAEKTLQSSRDMLRNAMQEQGAVEARHRALQESLLAGEGAAPGARNLLQAVKKGELTGEFRTVAQVLTVPPQLQRAIEAALGGSQNDILTPSETMAKAGIEWLKKNQAGRATFLPLDLLTPTRATFKPASANETILGIASDLIDYPVEAKPAVEWLLGRVLIAKDLDAATAYLKQMRSAKQNTGISRIATLDGEIVQASGAMSGGRIQNERRGALGLKAEVDALEREIEQMEKKVWRLARQTESDETGWLDLKERAESKLNRLQITTQTRLENETRLREAQRALNEAHHQVERLQKEREQIEAQLAATPALDEQAFQQTLETAREAHHRALQALAAWDSEKQRLAQEVGELKARVEQESQVKSAIDATLKARVERSQQTEREFESIRQERERLLVEREKLQSQAEQSAQQLQAMREERQRQLEEGFQISDQIKMKRLELQNFAKRERDLDLQIARLEVRQSELQERWRQEYGEESLEFSEVSKNEEAVDLAAMKRSVDSLRREIQAMGEVNTGAVEEYERLSERYETLSTQHADLMATCERLENALKEMDQAAREQFVSAFEAIRGAFQERYARLMEGGQADLILTLPNDPLSSGVLLEAQPPGKRRQRLELLSGGERAMTAAALLFAFLDVKPSPLCVLDEVDAALDGRNVERFVDHLKELASSSQTLVITHNPITSANADHWIGITMSEPGVSRVIPYTIQHVEGDIPSALTDQAVVETLDAVGLSHPTS